MLTYETPRVTFVGADPKLPALRAAIRRLVNTRRLAYVRNDSYEMRRFVGLWQARNRRTRVLMRKVQRANA